MTNEGVRNARQSKDMAAANDARGGRAATVVGIGIFLSRISGLVRQRIFNYYFGLSVESDLFNLASRIPNFMRSLFGEGALSASFVPVYTRLLARGDLAAANALAHAVLGLLMAAVSAFTLLGMAAAPAISMLFASPYTAEQRDLVTQLTRILFPMTAFMVLSGWCLGVQNSHRRFFWSYASAAMWNIAQIFLLWYAGSKVSPLGTLAVWLAWGTLAGSLLQVALQMPEILRLVKPFRITFDKTAQGVSDVFRNLTPVVTSLGVVQISSLIDMQIATRLPDGALSSIQNANTIVLLPVALFGISVAASSLPELARDSAIEASPDSNPDIVPIRPSGPVELSEASRTALLERLRAGWQRILFYVVPSAVACIAFGDLIVGLLFRSGKFGAEEQRIVHAVLAAYAIGLVSYGSVKLLSSVHYAIRDYRTPLRASIASVVLSALVAFGLSLPFRTSVYGGAAVAIGSALGSYVNLVMQIRGLRSRLGVLYTATMWNGTRRIVIATVIASLVAAPFRLFLDADKPIVSAPPTLAAFSIGYLVVAWWMGSGEAARWLRRPVRNSTRRD